MSTEPMLHEEQMLERVLKLRFPGWKIKGYDVPDMTSGINVTTPVVDFDIRIINESCKDPRNSHVLVAVDDKIFAFLNRLLPKTKQAVIASQKINHHSQLVSYLRSIYKFVS